MICATFAVGRPSFSTERFRVQVEMGGLLVGTFQLGRYAYLAHLDLSKREPYQLFGQPIERPGAKGQASR